LFSDGLQGRLKHEGKRKNQINILILNFKKLSFFYNIALENRRLSPILHAKQQRPETKQAV